MKPTAKIERFETLDSWRGICAVVVVIYHFSFLVNAEMLHNRLLSNAYLFVDFFFVLSGFVVCHAYRDKLASGRQFGGFLLRRIGRLWPLHLAILFGLMVAMTVINAGGFYPDSFTIEADRGNYSLHALLLNALLLNSMGFYGMSWNGPAWSIGAEFYTYVLFAIVTLSVGRRLLPAALIISLTAMVGILLFAPSFMNSTADFGLVRCIAGFFMGVVAYHAHDWLRDKSLPLATVSEIVVILLSGLFIASAGQGPDEVGATSVLAPVAFSAAILVFAREKGLLSKALQIRPLRALGVWSYSIYLIHMPLLVLLGYGIWLYGNVAGVPVRFDVMLDGHLKRLYDLGNPVATYAMLAGFIGVVIVLAAGTYALIEVSWRDWFGRVARNYETCGRTFELLRSRTVMAPSIPLRIGHDRAGR